MVLAYPIHSAYAKKNILNKCDIHSFDNYNMYILYFYSENKNK